MQKVLLLMGIPACGKSFFCKDLMQKEPKKWKRINNDSLRHSFDFDVHSTENEKIIGNLRNHLLREFLKQGYNVLIDNVNLNRLLFRNYSKVLDELNTDVQIIEKPFYIELEEALARNSKREGIAKVPEEVIKKFYKESGKEQFRFYKPRVETYYHKNLEITEGKIPAIICDLDGTLANIGNRSPYDASKCDLIDTPNTHVVKALKLYHRDDCKIIFCSGREEKDREPTIRFIQKALPDYMNYELFMRPSGDKRPDWQIKEEIFFNHFNGKYKIEAVFDDRLQVCRVWHRLGLPLFRVGNPEAAF